MTQRRKWLIGGIVGSLLILIFGYLFVISPAMSSLDDLNRAISSQNDENIRSAAKLEQLKKQVAEIPAKMQEIEQVKLKLPSTMEQPALVRSLEAAASSAGVDLTDITAVNPVQLDQTAGSSTLVALPYTMNAAGDYAALKTFVSELERQQRAFLITNLEIVESDAELGRLTMGLGGKFYAMQGYDVKPPTNLPPAPATSPAPTTAPQGAAQQGQQAAKLPKRTTKASVAAKHQAAKSAKRAATKTPKTEKRRAAKRIPAKSAKRAARTAAAQKADEQP